jgi:hypothetical protein
VEQARGAAERLKVGLKAAHEETGRRREAYLACRTGRRQVETLLENRRLEGELARARRAQQTLDDWYGRRKPQPAGTQSTAAAEGVTPRHESQ